MTARAHIRNVGGTWTLIRRYGDERGWITLEGSPAGKRDVSPVVIGYENGNDKVVPIETATNDTSTPGAETVGERVTTVEVNRVLDTTNIRNKTPQEISDERDIALAQLDTQQRDLQYAINIHVKEATAVMFAIARQINPNLTLQQFETFWNNNKNGITMIQFKTYLRDKQS